MCDQLEIRNELGEIVNDGIKLETKDNESLTKNVFRRKLRRTIKYIFNRKRFEETLK